MGQIDMRLEDAFWLSKYVRLQRKRFVAGVRLLQAS